MLARRAAPGYVPVELDDDAVAPEADRQHPGGASRAARGRRRGALAATAVALVAATGLVGAHIDARREEARLAALADVPYVLTPDAPLTESWRVPADGLLGEAGGVLVLAVDGGLVGVDGGSGQRVWERPAGDESCEPMVPTPVGPALGPLTGGLPAPTDRLLCTSPNRVGTPNESTTTVAVDARTGRAGPSILMGGVALAQIVRDEDVVLVNHRGGGVVEVVSWDPVTGGARWRTRSEPGALPEEDALLWWDRTVVAVTAGERTHAVSLHGGQRVTVDPADAGWIREEVALADGGRAEWGSRWVDLPVPRPSGQVLGPDGGHRFELPGRPVAAPVSDGSGPDVLVVERPPREVAGLDVGTGEQRWATTVRTLSGYPVVRMDGVLVLRADRSSVALDLRTGEVMWEVAHRGDAGFLAAPLTDGRAVLLWHQEDDDATLVAHDLHDGRELWRAPLPDGARRVEPTASGRLVVTGPGWVAALG